MVARVERREKNLPNRRGASGWSMVAEGTAGNGEARNSEERGEGKGEGARTGLSSRGALGREG